MKFFAVLLASTSLFCFTTLLTADSDKAEVRKDGDEWLAIVSGSANTAASLEIATIGDLTIRGSADSEIHYTIKRRLGNSEAAHLAIQQKPLILKDGQIVVAQPGSVEITVPRGTRMLAAVSRTGAVDVVGLSGSVHAEAFGGKIFLDHIGGDVVIQSSGGPTVLGTIGGNAQCFSGGGGIRAAVVHGKCVLETRGGDVEIGRADGAIRALTGGGAIHIDQAGAEVVADSYGGPVTVLHGAGLVTATTQDGPIEISDAPSVNCRSRSGSIRLTNVSGAVQAIAENGSITLMAGARGLRDSQLTARGGDILVELPSKLSVTVNADITGSMERSAIVSGFPGLETWREGVAITARGRINGGGPMLRLSTSSGKIEIRNSGR